MMHMFTEKLNEIVHKQSKEEPTKHKTQQQTPKTIHLCATRRNLPAKRCGTKLKSK